MDYQALRHSAREALGKAPYPPKRLALIHVGATLLVSLLMTLVNFFLARSYNAATGLGNADQRAILETVQLVLNLVNLVISPLWSIGFMAVALRTARWSNAEPRDLLDGFRCWGTVLRLYLLLIGIAFLLMFAVVQVSSILLAVSGLSRGVTNVLLEVQEQGGDPYLYLSENMLMPQMIPVFVVFFGLAAALAIPLFYRIRMAFFAVAEGETSARAAIGRSFRLTRGKAFSLFKIDLRFWWYYGALLLVGCLTSTESLLNLFGISLPLSDNMILYGSYGIYLVLNLLLCWQWSLSVRTTYALCYDRLKAELPPQPQTPPWNQSNSEQ